MMAQPPAIRDTRHKRILGHVKGREAGPVLVFFGGIHGNEPSGVEALEAVFKELESRSIPLKGSIYGIAGNIPALFKNKRYLEQDLNRLWTTKEIERIEENVGKKNSSEENELLDILSLLRELLNAYQAPFYFIDFHTTSSRTLPFITINDAMINRKFARQFPVPIILGIEEYLEGPVLSYINELGYVSLGFESGQHATEQARINSIAFFWLSLVFSGAISKESFEDYERYYSQLLNSASGNRNFYEITERYPLSPQDVFRMEPGFHSFEPVKKGTQLAQHNNKPVFALKKGILFMPLYQPQGAEGFFMIRRISQWILDLSSVLRRGKADQLLVALPGISWKDKSNSQLVVNLNVARFFSKAIFHLFGYRNRTLDQRHLLIKNREKTAKNHLYTESPWY